MRDLGTLGGRYSMAFAINEHGQIAGTSRPGPVGSGSREVFLWDGGKMRDLGPYGWDITWQELNGGYCCVVVNAEGAVAWRRRWSHGNVWVGGTLTALRFAIRDMNSRGQIVGVAYSKSTGGPGRAHAVLWQNGQLRDLGILPGYVSSDARAINDAGIVVGASYSANGERSAAVTWENGGIRELPTPAGLSKCSAVAVNSRGVVLGTCSGHAILWQGGRTRDLGADLEPVALSDRDQVMGSIPPYGAFFWNGEGVRKLGSLGGNRTFANDMNDRGQIVGSSLTLHGRLHAFVWDNGVMTDIGRPGSYSTSEALAINDRGEIVGWSQIGEPKPQGMEYSGPPSHAFLWMPTGA